MILTRTPLRVSLFGGGSDYPAWFLEHAPGAVLGFAIDKYVYVGVKRMPPGQLGADGAPLRYRVQYSHVDDCQSIDEIKHPAVRAVLRYLPSDDPLEFHMFADLPGRSGLGGSSACAVGLLHALSARNGTAPTPLTLAREAIAFEISRIGETVGFQDQLFAALGGMRFARFGRNGSDISKPLELSPARLSELESSLVLVYTGTMRDAHAMAAKQIERTPQNKYLLKTLAQFARDAHKLLSQNRPLSFFGALLNSAWSIKRELHPEISSPGIDALYWRGLALGALGGKLLGAGGGGFMAFWIPPSRRARFCAGIGVPVVQVKVSQTGSAIIIGENHD